MTRKKKAEVAATHTTVAAYKGFDLKMQCRGYQFIDEPSPDGGYKVTEYRRGHVVSVDINPGVTP